MKVRTLKFVSLMPLLFIFVFALTGWSSAHGQGPFGPTPAATPLPPFPSPTPGPTATPIPTATPLPPFPSPSAAPTAKPTPTPLPLTIAPQPMLNGLTNMVDSYPPATLALTYDVSQYPATAVYIELSRPNTPFSNPNGNVPDLNRLTYAYGAPGRSGIAFYPSQLPGWGTYYIRIVPIDANYVGLSLLSNSATLTMSP